MTPTRKTSQGTRPNEAESERSAELATEATTVPVTPERVASASLRREPVAPEAVTERLDAADPLGDAVQRPADAESDAVAHEVPVGEAPQLFAAEDHVGRPQPVEAPAQPYVPAPLSATQLQNDPLLGTHDEIIVDLGLKLRWAAVGWALLGAVASWLIAAQVGIATKSGTPFGWALAATILIFAGAVWYFADVSTRFTSVAAYRKAKTPQSIARLHRGAVVGLYSAIGAWIGVALGALVVVSGTVTAVLTLAFGASGWAWFFGAVPAALLYLYGFALLHYRLLEKTRDAVA
ncbi:hypothetical protein GCM10028798_32930 [Humibacter antri]